MFWLNQFYDRKSLSPQSSSCTEHTWLSVLDVIWQISAGTEMLWATGRFLTDFIWSSPSDFKVLLKITPQIPWHLLHLLKLLWYSSATSHIPWKWSAGEGEGSQQWSWPGRNCSALPHTSELITPKAAPPSPCSSSSQELHSSPPHLPPWKHNYSSGWLSFAFQVKDWYDLLRGKFMGALQVTESPGEVGMEYKFPTKEFIQYNLYS